MAAVVQIPAAVVRPLTEPLLTNITPAPKKHENDLEIRFSIKVQKDHSLQGLFELLSTYDDILEISTNF